MITKEDLQKAKEMYEEVFGYDPKHGSLSAGSTIAIIMLAKEINASIKTN
jgi:predicted enzyme related to lactoylglutathione lyase